MAGHLTIGTEGLAECTGVIKTPDAFAAFTEMSCDSCRRWARKMYIRAGGAHWLCKRCADLYDRAHPQKVQKKWGNA